MELQKTKYPDELQGYGITSDGDVISKYGEKMSKQLKLGYLCVNLRINNKTISTRVHRLVAQFFIDNPYCKTQVNHKNGDKSDNRVENLEWMTPSENTKHAYDMGLCENVKKKTSEARSKKVYDTRTGLYYKSAKEASECKHINYGTLRNMLNGHDRNKTSLIYA